MFLASPLVTAEHLKSLNTEDIADVDAVDGNQIEVEATIGQ